MRVQGMERRWRILVEEKEGEKERLRKNKKKNKGRIEFPSRPLLIVNRLEIRKKKSYRYEYKDCSSDLC